MEPSSLGILLYSIFKFLIGNPSLYRNMLQACCILQWNFFGAACPSINRGSTLVPVLACWYAFRQRLVGSVTTSPPGSAGSYHCLIIIPEYAKSSLARLVLASTSSPLRLSPRLWGYPLTLFLFSGRGLELRQVRVDVMLLIENVL
jgi:hypothetical protein